MAWNEGKPLRDTLLDLYKTEAAPGVKADVIYTFWVKHAICTDPTCKKEVPLFKDYIVAHKIASMRYWRDISCPECGKSFDWEAEVASLIAEADGERAARCGRRRPSYRRMDLCAGTRKTEAPARAHAYRVGLPCCAKPSSWPCLGSRRKKRKRSRSLYCSAPPAKSFGNGVGLYPNAK